MSARLFAPALLAILFIALPSAFAYADCPAGSTPATAGDLAAMKAAGIPNPTVGTCWQKTDSSTGASTAQAKQELETYKCKASVDVQGLDSKFATCAVSFMKNLRSVDPSACINSAYRSTQYQANVCKSICGNSGGCPGLCAPPGKSYHQKGLAVDMQSTVSNTRLWQIAAQSSLYNPSGLHRSDPRHLQASGGSSCSAGDVPTGDTGDYYNDTGNYFQSTSLPFDNSLRSTLGVPSAQATPAQIGTPAQTGQPTAPSTPATSAATTPTSSAAPSLNSVNTTPYTAGTCTPQTYCSPQDGNIYYRTTSCVDQPYQSCPNGCSGIVCNAASSTSSNTQLSSAWGSDTNTNQNTNTNTNSSTSSFDLISYIASGQATGVEVGTATPVDISNAVQDTGNANVLQPDYASLQQGNAIQTPSQASVYGPVPSQTFTSSDLANSPSSGFFGDSSQGLYERIKVTLVNILGYLRPFGSLNAPQYSS